MTILLVAQYTTQKIYKIPKGIDLEDESVEEYNLVWNTLCIKRKGKEELEEYELDIEYDDEDGSFYKRPMELTIDDDGEEEDEEEEEDKEEED